MQLWSNDGRLGMIVYGWSGGGLVRLWGRDDMGAGAGAVSWQSGDFNGDGKEELLQLWSNDSSAGMYFYGVNLSHVHPPDFTLGGSHMLGMVVYGGDGNAMAKLWSIDTLCESSNAVAWLVGDLDANGRLELVRLWSNPASANPLVSHNRLASSVYGMDD